MVSITIKLPKINMRKIPQATKDMWQKNAIEYLNKLSRDDIVEQM